MPVSRPGLDINNVQRPNEFGAALPLLNTRRCHDSKYFVGF